MLEFYLHTLRRIYLYGHFSFMAIVLQFHKLQIIRKIPPSVEDLNNAIDHPAA